MGLPLTLTPTVSYESYSYGSTLCLDDHLVVNSSEKGRYLKIPRKTYLCYLEYELKSIESQLLKLLFFLKFSKTGLAQAEQCFKIQ